MAYTQVGKVSFCEYTRLVKQDTSETKFRLTYCSQLPLDLWGWCVKSSSAYREKGRASHLLNSRLACLPRAVTNTTCTPPSFSPEGLQHWDLALLSPSPLTSFVPQAYLSRPQTWLSLLAPWPAWSQGREDEARLRLWRVLLSWGRQKCRQVQVCEEGWKCGPRPQDSEQRPRQVHQDAIQSKWVIPNSLPVPLPSW